MLDISEALCVYLGADASGGYQPGEGGDERLGTAYPLRYMEARSAIARYLDGPGYPPSEWSSNDLAREQGIYEHKLRAAFPELNARAIHALACRWSFNWR